MNDEIKLQDREAVDDIDYRPFNSLALVALLVSLLSFFAILTPVMVAFSVLGIFIALGALYVGRGKHGPAMAGNGLALVAMFVAVLFGSFALSNRLAYRQYLSYYATKHSHTFLQELFNAEFGKVFGYAADVQNRLPKDTDLEEHFQRTEARPGEQYPPSLAMYMMKRSPPLPEFFADNLQGKTEYLGIGLIDRDLQDEIVGVDYRYLPESSDMEPIEYRLILFRQDLPPPYMVQWKVEKFEVLKGAKKERELEFTGVTTKKSKGVEEDNSNK